MSRKGLASRGSSCSQKGVLASGEKGGNKKHYNKDFIHKNGFQKRKNLNPNPRGKDS
jgi:hypothetical protein